MQTYTQEHTQPEINTPKPRQLRRSPAQWQMLIDQWQNSGLSMQAFCKANNLVYQSFCNWKTKLVSAVHSNQVETTPTFIDLSSVSHHTQASWQITLKLADGIELQLSQPSC